MNDVPEFHGMFARQERHGFRDERISKRHREWGVDCPCVDLDFPVIEFHLAKPVAVIEYKHANALARFPDFRHATYRGLSAFADNSNVPFAVVFYWPEIWAFRVYPVNAIAQQHFENPEDMCERDFVQRIYRLRRLVLAKALAGTLGDDMPPTRGREICGNG